MQQCELLEADEYEALRRDVEAVGGPQTVALMLLPTEDPIKNGIWISNCLDRKRKQKLEPGHYTQIINAARKKRGYSEYLIYLCDATWHEPPKTKALNKEVIDISSKLNVLTDSAKELIDYLIKAKEALND